MTTAAIPHTTAATPPAPCVAAPTAICPGCGKSFERVLTVNAPGYGARFCTKACGKKLGNRAVSQGSPLVPLAMAWRLSRNSASRKALGAACFEQLVQLVDMLIDEEREEGRSSAMMLDYAAELIAEGDVRDRLRRKARKSVERRKRAAA